MPNVTFKASVAALIESARVARLATVDGRGRPHIVPVCFAVVNGCIYSPLDEKPKRVEDARLRRVRNIEAHPAVCFLVDRYSEDWSRLAWAQVRGEAAIVQPGEDGHGAAVAALRGRYLQYRAMAIDRRPLVRVQPRQIVSWGV